MAGDEQEVYNSKLSRFRWLAETPALGRLTPRRRGTDGGVNSPLCLNQPGAQPATPPHLRPLHSTALLLIPQPELFDRQARWGDNRDANHRVGILLIRLRGSCAHFSIFTHFRRSRFLYGKCRARPGHKHRCLNLAGQVSATAPSPIIIGNHPAVYNAEGILLPWTSWTDAITREMNWYFACPFEHGYPGSL